MNLLAADLFLFSLVACAVEGKGSLAAAKIGHAHGGQEYAAKAFRWECDGYANNVTEDAVLTEHIPKRLPPPQQSNVRPAKWNSILAEFERSRSATNTN